MRDSWELRSPTTLLAGFGLVTVVALVVAASTSTAAFGVYNPAWDGASDVQAVADEAGASSEIARDVTAYARVQPNETVAVVLSPDAAYSPDERERLAAFVRNGGTLVVAEDYGQHANALLRAVGAEARVDGRPLRDERHYYRSPAMAVARNVTDHSLVAGVDALTLNHGTAVVARNATVLARTSGHAYLDENRNADVDDAETVRAYPVATIERVGRGQVVVVGDPSLLINVMLDRPGNRAFAANLFAGHAHVLLDYSHAANLPPLAVVVLELRESTLLQLFTGALGVLVVLLAARTSLIDRVRGGAGPAGSSSSEGVSSLGVTDEELVAYLRERHPEWDADRVERVVASRRK